MHKIFSTCLSYSYFKGCRLWWDAVCHEIGMTYPYMHARHKSGKRDWPAISVDDSCIFWYVELYDGVRVGALYRSEAPVLSVYL